MSDMNRRGFMGWMVSALAAVGLTKIPVQAQPVAESAPPIPPSPTPEVDTTWLECCRVTLARPITRAGIGPDGGVPLASWIGPLDFIEGRDVGHKPGWRWGWDAEEHCHKVWLYPKTEGAEGYWEMKYDVFSPTCGVFVTQTPALLVRDKIIVIGPIKSRKEVRGATVNENAKGCGDFGDPRFLSVAFVDRTPFLRCEAVVKGIRQDENMPQGAKTVYWESTKPQYEIGYWHYATSRDKWM